MSLSMHASPSLIRRYIATMVLAALFVSMANVSDAKNLIKNSSFEEGLAGWDMFSHSESVSIRRISDVSYSGKYSIRIDAMPPVRSGGKSAGIHSHWVSVNENALIESSVWVRAENIVPCGIPAIRDCKNWYNFRVTLTAFDANNQKVRPKGHWDIVSIGGDICSRADNGECGWVRFRHSLVTPPGTAKMRMEIKFTSSTGVAWVDDAELREIISKRDLSSQQHDVPLVYPEPAYMKVRAGPRQWRGRVSAAVHHGRDPRLLTQVKTLFPSVSFGSNTAGAAQSIVIGGPSERSIDDLRKQRYPERDWVELGEEGYFISHVESNDRQTIYIGSNTAQGAFYALQTLRQLYSDGMIVPVDLWDYPEVTRRGIAMGLHWFREGGTGRIAIERLAERKANMIWNQGSYMDGKFSYAWREPFSHAELRAMRRYHDLAVSNFMDVHLSFGPRTRFSSSGCTQLDKYPTPMFSSHDEVNTLLGKMKALYDLGFRNFGINYDDLEHCGEDILRHSDDIEKFSGDIGRAHVHFANAVYKGLREFDSDISFMVIPLWYTNASSIAGSIKSPKHAYLREMKGLDSDIELISVQVVEDDFDAFDDLTGRPTLLWTNYFTMISDVDVSLPWISLFPWNSVSVTGYLFLPATPTLPEKGREDGGSLSWDSALGYAWAPSRYDPVSAIKHVQR